MTTERQKQTERHYVHQFRKAHSDWVEIEEGEKPDFRIRCASGTDIGLEVVEYYAASQDVPGQNRVAVEARWWKSLWPLLDQERQSQSALCGVQVHLRFNEPQGPDKRGHQALAGELVQVIQVAAARAVPGREVDVEFVPQATVDEANSLMPEHYFLAQEQWPLASRHLASLWVSRWPIDAWPSWICLNVKAACPVPDRTEFKRALEGKAKKAQGYALAGAPLWLLVVCETTGDLESHVFPQGNQDVAVLESKIRENCFDFAGGPFAEVWLLSEFTGIQRRLHPPHV
jgi:hypothetical protein